MIKLYGMGMSNYTSLAKAVLLEKGVGFEEVGVPPSQKDEFLAKSPMGKIPALETDHGFISETFAIADYLDHIQPQPALLPKDPYARAKAIELIRHMELDIELVARRCLPEAFFGATVSQEVKDSTQKDLEKGMKSIKRLLVCDPFVTGADFCLADIYVFYTFSLASTIVQKIFNTDLLESTPELKTLMGQLAERDSIKAVEAAKAAA